jgi:hypothetical protein
VQTVESTGNLDYKSTATPLFELMIVRLSRAAGGIPVKDDALGTSGRSLMFTTDWGTMRIHVEVIQWLVRRYKYLS